MEKFLSVLPFKYLSISEVCAAFGNCGRSSLYSAIQKGNAPPPDKVGSRSLWRSDVIAAWLEKRAADAAAERDERAKIAKSAAQRMVKARAKRRWLDGERR